MRFRFWPNTLAVQLILVVAGAVAVSNIAVAFYFYNHDEAQARNFTYDRAIDRAVDPIHLGRLRATPPVLGCATVGM